jgi:hypothetical protein
MRTMKRKVMAVASIGGHWILKSAIFSEKQKKKTYLR